MELTWPLPENLDAAQARAIQIGQLRKCGYNVDESQVPIPDNPDGILVDAAMSPIQQCLLLGIDAAINRDAGYFSVQIPLSNARWQWLYDVQPEKKIAGITPAAAELRLKEKGRRGLTLREGLALYRQDRDVVGKTDLLCLIGSHNHRSKPLGERGTIRMFPVLDRTDFGDHPELTTRPAESVSANSVFFSVPRIHRII